MNILTVSEAARHIGVSAETIRLWADSGKLKCRRTAKGFRIFTWPDVEEARVFRMNKLKHKIDVAGDRSPVVEYH